MIVKTEMLWSRWAIREFASLPKQNKIKNNKKIGSTVMPNVLKH